MWTSDRDCVVAIVTEPSAATEWTGMMAQWAQRQFPAAAIPLPTGCAIDRLSPTSLAYIGDAVYECYTRLRYLFPPQRIAAYHRAVVDQVRAEQQAAHLTHLLPHLTPDEQAWVRRGRNAATRRPTRLAAKVYQQASGFETLVGYLYLTQPERLCQLLALLPSSSI